MQTTYAMKINCAIRAKERTLLFQTKKKKKGGGEGKESMSVWHTHTRPAERSMILQMGSWWELLLGNVERGWDQHLDSALESWVEKGLLCVFVDHELGGGGKNGTDGSHATRGKPIEKKVMEGRYSTSKQAHQVAKRPKRGKVFTFFENKKIRKNTCPTNSAPPN